jgi:NADPH:quinone reductase-like Zn-dependent oxidoreductase
MRLAAVRSSQKAVFFIAKLTREDLETIGELLASGQVVPVVDKTYSLDEVRDAFRHLGEGHAQGKVVVNVD